MKITNHEGGEERQVLIGMITDPLVLGRIAPRWQREGMFRSKWANLVGGWCVKYNERYQKAPAADIEPIFRSWAGKGERDEETVKLVDRFLASLNDDYTHNGQVTSEYLIDLAGQHFQAVALKRLAVRIKQSLGAGDVDSASQHVKEFSAIELVGRNGLVRSSDIVPCQVHWLWEGWLPLGELTVIDGDPGCGKSQLTLDVAARLSRGWLMPPYPRKPGMVPQRPGTSIILSTEDAAETVIRPRLDALNADCDRILLLGKEGELPTLPQEVPWLENKIVEHNAKLVVLDPFYGFLGAKVESNTDPKIRQALSPLAQVAHRTGCAIVLIRHLNKKSDELVLYRGGGSIAVVAQCRSALVIGRDPANPTRRVVASNKTSLCRSPVSIAFEVQSTENEFGGTSRLSWLGEVELSAQDVLARPNKGKQGRPSQLDEIAEFIKTALADGEMPVMKLQEQVMSKFEISDKTFYTARKVAGVKSKQIGFQGTRMAFIP
jgi:hypothetical protein